MRWRMPGKAASEIPPRWHYGGHLYDLVSFNAVLSQAHPPCFIGIIGYLSFHRL
jgi:hypothetical protein